MLFKSGINLEKETINFINESNDITIFSAYLKTEELKKINISKKIKRIIVRWDIQDLHLGISDIDLYDYCKLNDIALYRNTRLHLKVFWNNQRDIVFGSANVTNKGLGELGRYNFELNGRLNSISNEDILYFNKIIFESEYVDINLFNKINSILSSITIEPFIYPLLDTKKSIIDKYLISQLPQTKNIDTLIKNYFNITKLNSEDSLRLMHDLTLYNLINIDNEETLINKLKLEFNTHPFIESFKKVVINEPNYSMRFGVVRRWFAENTTTVPTPTPWDLNVNIQILYDWICYFDNRFSWSRPGGHSQVIFFNENSK
jgi:hypothetical protein